MRIGPYKTAPPCRVFVVLAALMAVLAFSQVEARTLILTQNFTPGSAKALQAALTDDVDTVILNVSGGYLEEGMAIGKLLRARRLRVIVPAGGQCLSACAEAFLGGVSYQINGVLAFHIPRAARLGNREQAFNVGLAGGTLTSIYRFEMGFGFSLTQDINKWTSPERLLVFKTAAELLSYQGGQAPRRLPRLMDYGG